MSTHEVDGPTLWEALDAKRRDEGLSWRAVARKLELPNSTFTRIKDPAHGIHADAFVTMLHWLGQCHAEFTYRVGSLVPVSEKDPTGVV